MGIGAACLLSRDNRVGTLGNHARFSGCLSKLRTDEDDTLPRHSIEPEPDRESSCQADEPTTGKTDGRATRRSRNRDAVLDSVLAMLDERRLLPTSEAIAARSQVSLRSINRYFPTEQDLMVAALDHQIRVDERLVELERVGMGTLSERIERLVSNRLAIYREARGTIRIPSLVVDTMPLVAERVAHQEDRIRSQIQEHFDPELSGLSKDAAATALICTELLTHFASIDRMHTDRGMTSRAVKQALVAGLTAMLCASARGSEENVRPAD